MMRQDRPIDMEGVRERLKRRMKEKKTSARALALLTGDEPKTVQRYVSGDTETIPADFIGRCEAKGFASAQWLLLEKGSPDVTPPDEAVERLTIIGEIADGKISDEALEAMKRLRGGTAKEIARAIRALEEGGAGPSSEEDA